MVLIKPCMNGKCHCSVVIKPLSKCAGDQGVIGILGYGWLRSFVQKTMCMNWRINIRSPQSTRTKFIPFEKVADQEMVQF